MSYPMVWRNQKLVCYGNLLFGWKEKKGREEERKWKNKEKKKYYYNSIPNPKAFIINIWRLQL